VVGVLVICSIKINININSMNLKKNITTLFLITLSTGSFAFAETGGKVTANEANGSTTKKTMLRHTEMKKHNEASSTEEMAAKKADVALAKKAKEEKRAAAKKLREDAQAAKKAAKAARMAKMSAKKKPGTVLTTDPVPSVNGSTSTVGQ
jgi:hypothetical protein